MKTIETVVYNFDELTKEAKEKAIQKYYENEDYSFLPDDLMRQFKYLAEENGITYADIRLLYSLSYSQGDGLCFTGTIRKNGINLFLTHNWRYYYAKSVHMVFTEDESGEEVEPETNELAFDLQTLYLDICSILEKLGYGILEYRMDNEEFLEMCEANDYTFLPDGTMKNY
jgi:hypothetical protein